MRFPFEPNAEHPPGRFLIQDTSYRRRILPLFSFTQGTPEMRVLGQGTVFRIDPWENCATAFHVFEDEFYLGGKTGREMLARSPPSPAGWSGYSCMISAFSPFDQSAIGSYRERAGFLQYRACAASFFPFRSSLTSFRFAADIARGVVQCGLCAGMRPARSDGVHQSCSCYSNGRGPEAGGVPLPRPEGPAACTGTALFEAVRPLVALVSTRS